MVQDIACISRSSRDAAVKMSLNVAKSQATGGRRLNALHSSLNSPVVNIWMNDLVVIWTMVKGEAPASANSTASLI